jgi:hypothetical protein
MAGKFIELKDAAEQLGIAPERLLEMREAGDVHGYRDGASWKFKTSEIERVASELGSEAAPSDDVMDFSLSDSSALSDDEFDSLLNVSADEESEIDLEGGSSILISEEAGSGVDESSSSTVIGKEKKGEGVDEDSDLKLAQQPEDEELKLSEEPLHEELELSNDLELESDDDALALGEDSELSLSESDDELELDLSASSDALGESDSGISLAPSDSGLSLEGQGESSDALELPEDEEMISLENEIEASPDDATQLKQDEEFLLSPSDEMLGDESSDSGSQVIALEDSEAFEDDAAVPVEEPALLAEESAGLEEQLEPFEGAALQEAKVALPGAGELPEASYSIWNVLGLLLIVMLLGVTGMLMTDVVRNMWSWNGSSTMTTSLMDAIVSALGLQ